MHTALLREAVKDKLKVHEVKQHYQTKAIKF